jgi:hypothetical protein
MADFPAAIDHSASAILRKTVSGDAKSPSRDWRFTRDASATRKNYPPSRLVMSGSFFRRKRNQLFHVLRMLSRGVR